MSTARSAGPDTDADTLASAIGAAGFVRVCARGDGSSLAAAGLLARACREHGVPFQVRLARDPSLRTGDASDDLDVTVGAAGGAVSLTRDPVRTAFDAARTLGADPSPALALAGIVAGGGVPGDATDGPLDAAAASETTLDRRPGVVSPTDHPLDGLAHSTLVHAPFSGDPDAARAALDEAGITVPDADADAGGDENGASSVDDTVRRRVASLLTIRTVGDPAASERSATAVGRGVHPRHTDGPFATVGGYADVLDAVARERPGTGVALALGHDARESALEAWRDHARAAHGLVGTADTARYDGLFVARVGTDATTDDVATRRVLGRLATAARLVRDFRSPEPVALVVGDGVAAAASVDDRGLDEALAAAARATTEDDDSTVSDAAADDPDAAEAESEAGNSAAATGYGTARAAEARYVGERPEFVAAVREALG